MNSTDILSQRSSTAHNFVPKTRRDWLLVCAMILGFGLIAHISISSARHILGIQTPQPEWIMFLFATLYTAIIMLSQIYSSALAHKLVPLRGKASALVHILIQSISAVVAFAAGMRFDQYIWDQCSVPSQLFVSICVITFVLSLIGNGVFYFIYFQRQVRAAKQAVLESELTVLRAQINPHFLFNTLNSIAALIRSNPDQAERVTEYLADLFRYSLRSSKTPLVRLEDELESIDLYLKIEEARFGERLRTSVRIPAELLSASVPSLLLQPLVENAVKHGANHCEGSFDILVEATRVAGTISVRVQDSGDGFDVNESTSIFDRGTGLANVRDRLFLVFPNESTMRFEKNAVVLNFPFRSSSDIVDSQSRTASRAIT